MNLYNILVTFLLGAFLAGCAGSGDFGEADVDLGYDWVSVSAPDNTLMIRDSFYSIGVSAGDETFTFTDEGYVDVNGTTVSFTSTCNEKKGTYEASRVDNQMTFTEIIDNCPERAAILAGEWNSHASNDCEDVTVTCTFVTNDGISGCWTQRYTAGSCALWYCPFCCDPDHCSTNWTAPDKAIMRCNWLLGGRTDARIGNIWWYGASGMQKTYIYGSPTRGCN